MKYHAIYVKDCSLRLKSFKKENDLLAWVGRFHLDNLENEDNWIDVTFYGNLGAVNPTIDVENE